MLENETENSIRKCMAIIKIKQRILVELACSGTQPPDQTTSASCLPFQKRDCVLNVRKLPSAKSTVLFHVKSCRRKCLCLWETLVLTSGSHSAVISTCKLDNCTMISLEYGWSPLVGYTFFCAINMGARAMTPKRVV